MTTKVKPFGPKGSPFKAKNSDTLITQFDDRLGYQLFHPYLYDEEFPVPINFWGPNNAFYGRVDSNRDFIFPKTNYMKQISDLYGKDVYVLNFVADAYEDFVKYLKIKKSNKLLTDDNFTLDWTAKRGWSSFSSQYDEYLQAFIESYAFDYLESSNRHVEISDFESFISIMLKDYIFEMVSDYPLTKTGFLYSSYYSPMSTGLCVEISEADHGDDEAKQYNFLNNENFKLYCLAASKFGFLVDKNAPWRLVANLNSKQMRSYIAKYISIINSSGLSDSSVNGHRHDYYMDANGDGQTTSIVQGNLGAVPAHSHKITEGVVEPYGADMISHGHLLNLVSPKDFTTDDIYRIFFEKTSIDDTRSLKGTFVKAYNDYINDYRTVTVPHTCTYSGNNETLLKTVARKKITVKQVDKTYSDIFWLKMFFQIRLKELKVNLPNPVLKNNLKKISILNKTVDFFEAINYIDRYLKQYY